MSNIPDFTWWLITCQGAVPPTDAARRLAETLNAMDAIVTWWGRWIVEKKTKRGNPTVPHFHGLICLGSYLKKKKWLISEIKDSVDPPPRRRGSPLWTFRYAYNPRRCYFEYVLKNVSDEASEVFRFSDGSVVFEHPDHVFRSRF